MLQNYIILAKIQYVHNPYRFFRGWLLCWAKTAIGVLDELLLFPAILV